MPESTSVRRCGGYTLPMDDALRHPIGPFHPRVSYSAAERLESIQQLAEVPTRLRSALEGLTPEQLDTPYREGGWTLRQVAHHLPDSHLGGYVRCKLTLTEDEPMYKTYRQERWAELADTSLTPVEVSVTLLGALHERWVNLLRSLGEADFARTQRHPKLGTDNPQAEARWVAACVRRAPDYGVITLDSTVALYAWHGRHHVAQIESLRGRRGWV